MMFCKICDNFMDITNNVSFTNDKQTGGQTDESDAESSDYDVDMSEQQSSSKNSNINEEEIQKILEDVDPDIIKKNFNISDLTKNPSFNKLTNNQKTLVINRILDKIPKLNKVNKQTDVGVVKESYLYCKNCGFYEKIPNKMFIFSRNSTNNDDAYNFRFLNYKYDNTLPTSKNYNCINDECITHKQPEFKKAVFYKYNNTYAVRYLCTACDSFWSTFNEN